MSAADVEPIVVQSPTTVTTVTDALVGMLQNYFSNPERNLVSPGLQKNTRWAEAPEDSKIQICAQASEIKDTNHKPALLVRRAAWKLGNASIGGVVQNDEPEPGYRDRTAAKTLEGAHSISCIARTEQVADELAHELLIMFTVHSHVCLQAVGLVMNVVAISEPTLANNETEYKGCFVTTVTVAYNETLLIDVYRNTPTWKQMRFSQQ